MARGLLAGAAAVAVPRMGWAQAPGAVMLRLSSYMAGAAEAALPEAAAQATRLHVLDTIGAMVSGSTLPPGRHAIDFARAYGGPDRCTVVASTVLCGPIEAALANAVLAHSDETDDSHAPSQSHPGAAIVPATLAAAEQWNASGTRFLRAVALGYDVGTRVTMVLDPDLFQTKGHKSTHAVAGAWGAAAAAGCCAGLDAQRMRWLLDYTAQQSSGIAVWQRDRDHIEKAVAFAGMGARNGVTGALLVASGWTGVDDVLSGADSFMEAYGPGRDAAGLVEGLGQRYEVERTNIKKWTVGSPIQAPLDALHALMERYGFKAADVRSVTVRMATREAAVVDNRTIPDISLQHMVAVMLLDGTASFAAAHDAARMNDPAVLRERAKVRLVPDAELERHLPAREAVVEVELTDGRRLSERVAAVRGTAQNPMTEAEVVAKVRDLVVPVLGRDKAEALIGRVMRLEDVESVRALRPLLQA